MKLDARSGGLVALGLLELALLACAPPSTGSRTLRAGPLTCSEKVSQNAPAQTALDCDSSAPEAGCTGQQIGCWFVAGSTGDAGPDAAFHAEICAGCCDQASSGGGDTQVQGAHGSSCAAISCASADDCPVEFGGGCVDGACQF